MDFIQLGFWLSILLTSIASFAASHTKNKKLFTILSIIFISIGVILFCVLAFQAISTFIANNS